MTHPSTHAQQDAALAAIYAIKYFDLEQCIALLQAVQQKSKSTLFKGEWSTLADNALDDLLTDLKWHHAREESDHG